MRYFPRDIYNCMPCSYVSVGVAYENLYGKSFEFEELSGYKEDGYLNLDEMNKFIRSKLPIKKKVYYKRTDRITLKEFMSTNIEKCIVCVLGHYLYVEDKYYWSFFDNENDKVVCVWYIKE